MAKPQNNPNDGAPAEETKQPVQVAGYTRRAPNRSDEKPEPVDLDKEMIALTSNAFDSDDADDSEPEEPKASEKKATPTADEPKANKHSPSLIALARQFGLDDISGMTRSEVMDEIAVERIRREEEEKEETRQRSRAEAAKKKPEPEPEDDLGEFEDEDGEKKPVAKHLNEIHPAIRAVLKKQIEDNKKLRDEIAAEKKKAEAEKASAANERLIDKAFAALPTKFKKVIGEGTMSDLVEAEDNANAFRRQQIVTLALQLQNSGVKGDAKTLIGQASDLLFGNLVGEGDPEDETPKPKAKAKPPEPEPEEEEKPVPKAKNGKLKDEQDRWNRGGVAQPTNREPGKKSQLAETLKRINERDDADGEGVKPTEDPGLKNFFS